MLFNGKSIQLLTFQQLEQMSRQNLKIRVKTLQEQLEDQNLPALAGHGPDLTIEWILSVQCAICMGKGLRLTPADFGAPSTANAEGFFGRGEAYPQSQKGKADQWSHSRDMRAPMGDHNPSHQGAYEEACFGAAAARERNRGSNIFG
jgi:hypothetical protein